MYMVKQARDFTHRARIQSKVMALAAHTATVAHTVALTHSLHGG